MSSTGTNTQISGRIERLPFSAWHLKVFIPLGSGWFFDAFDSTMIAYVLPVLAGTWALKQRDIGALISIGYMGQVIGSIFFGWLAERIGRVRCTIYTLILFSVMSLACAFAWDLRSLALMRFIQGIGLGGESPVLMSYVSEFAPSKSRGQFTMAFHLWFPAGILCAGLAGLLVLPHFDWRWMFVLGALPALVALPLRWLLPESPRWLASQGRIAEADKVLSQIESEISKGGKVPLPPIPQGMPSIKPAQTRISELLSGIYLRRSLTVWAIWFFSYSVTYGLTNWVPSIFRTVYHVSIQQSVTYGFANNIAGVVGTILPLLLIDRVGRRPLFAVGQFLTAIPLLVVAFSPALDAHTVGLLVSASSFFLATLAISLATYTVELYPTTIRALGCGVGYAWMRAASIIAPFMVGSILSAGGGIAKVFLIFGVLAAIGGVLMLFAVETRGKSLEHLSPES